ncbi:bacteriocin-processing peptidase. Cysteine peptidase. MEROPS family C39 [Chitinophaga rupis]|uniref:Bacteriocin-processing peptidase. Cysteine peptidase. MEROPS family C39 n=1 Tax=Chitinophaga rupis TaxID=573321 RepID=A0A1H8F1K1_9BACT|nr:peptidase domain-containing ABC transporter [Chitinophaga rupis]SEN25264.1 bacteriocin-processing peptidase. Cysteine peptidase. MEROPS family C39 [Chitinophaga rupis]
MTNDARLKRSARVKQRDISDCGAACLASVAAYYHLQLPVARIRQYAGTDRKGTNVLGVIEAAQKLGFQAKGVKGPLEALNNIPKPAIAHVVVNGLLQHFVVVYRVTAKQVVVMDPIDGMYHHLSHDDFKKTWTSVLVLLMPDEDFKTGNEKISHLQRFWYLLRPHRSVLTQSLFGAVIYTVLGLSTSIYVQKIVDNVLVEGNRNLLNLLGVIMLIILLLQLFVGNLKSIFAVKTGQQLDAQLILGYYKHLLKLPQQFFDTMRVGEITSRIGDAVKIRVFINDVALTLVVNVFIVIFSFALMFTYYWKLALIMLGIIPVYLLIYQVSNRVNKKLQRRLMEDNAELGSQLVESLNSVATIKRFGLEEYANMRTEHRFIRLLKTIYHSTISNLYIGSAANVVTSGFVIALLWIGSVFVINRELSPGELLSFYALVGYFTGPAMGLITANKSMQDALIAADRLFEIIDLEQEETAQKVELQPGMIGNIVFNNVTFSYGSRVPVFRHFNLEIQKGRITAIVGESGSGKSTLMSLLQNIYPLKEGTIAIGHTDIRYIQHESLRRLVSVVPQQIDLFAGPITANIAVGEFEPDIQQVLRISQQLGILEFIEKLPDGFNTLLGEHGVNLSGGQRQRIAIARALYRHPEILILDEATSSLDPVSDLYVQNVMQELRDAGKTVIVIAHRLSTVVNADQIVVLQDGALAEEGTHKQLLARNTVYAKLWSHHQGMLQG